MKLSIKWKCTFSGRFSAAIICFILSSRPLRTAHIRSSRVTSSICEMYFLLQYLSEVSSMYFSPCSFARFRFSSRSVKDSFFELQKISFDFFYFVTFCFNFWKTIFGEHSLILCASASSKIGFDNRSTSFHLRRFLLFELSPK